MEFHNVMLDLLLCFQTFLLTPLLSVLKVSNTKTEHSIIRDKKHDLAELITEGELKVVMERLGIRYEVVESMQGADETLGDEMFGREEPSLEEIKEAFDVFDENRDGYVDETELQRVLRCLGVKESLVQVEECRRMIKVADENGDGRIDFNEFLKFMETCFC